LLPGWRIESRGRVNASEPAPNAGAGPGELGVRGIEEAAARFGRPVERSYRLDVGQEDFRHRKRIRAKRCGEVILAVRRKNGEFLLHTKTFYPPGAYRLPSGGVEPGEDLATAVGREAREETGLDLCIDRFLGILRYRFCWQGLESDFTSHVFLLSEIGGTLAAQDIGERISGYREVPLSELPEVARALEHLADPGWEAWGRFRALAHRFVAEVLSQDSG